MEKYFNIAGPCFPNRHYMLPALDRMPEIRRLVEQEMYFAIHAPRQTGKTTAVKALAREINAKGEMVALYCTLETLQNALGQLAGYLADLGLPEDWMAVFDDDAAKSWDEKIFRRDETCNGKTIHIVGL